MTATDFAMLLAIVVVGPWGLVLAIALLKGYSLRLLFTPPHRFVKRDEVDVDADDDG
jgi:hypothetical protein